MDTTIQKLLNDKLYDKRKSGALELEALTRDCLAAGDNPRIAKIVHQLCHDYAYAVHQPHARNGGLIGLAAASIALGPEVARYLEEIIPPVLACFSDQDARVRYYACESMYNIAKVAKGEILVYFNPIFDALSKLAADSELSVKNGAELLDRLIKDIVAESASSYVSVVIDTEKSGHDEAAGPDADRSEAPAFSLARFIPLLTDRITVLNPYTRMFLVSWLTLLDSIPDLELVTYLPSFLAGVFRYLSDSNPDVHTATQVCLDKFLVEIKKIARLKAGLALSKRSNLGGTKRSSSAGSRASHRSGSRTASVTASGDEDSGSDSDEAEDGREVSDSDSEEDGIDFVEDDWTPGQDVQVDHMKILDILVGFLAGTPEEEILLTALRWIDGFFEICPEDILGVVPRLLSHVLPAMSNNVEKVRRAANNVNSSLMNYILSIPDDESVPPPFAPPMAPAVSVQDTSSTQPSTATTNNGARRGSTLSAKPPQPSNPGRDTPVSVVSEAPEDMALQIDGTDPTGSDQAQSKQGSNLDYDATVNALTLQFLNEHEATRVAALNWLIMLQRKAPPGRQLEINDGTFPALLKTLSDMSDVVVTRDLLLLSQMFRDSDDAKFQSFMVNLLKLFCTDRRLLETRGNLIIRQLCISLSADRVYRTLADCLERDEDVEFASIMVQNLNNNLVTAPELADLRKRLRNLDTREGQLFFVTLFRAWCHNAVATFSLCLLAQAYEQAYHLLQIFADLEMTVNILIQIDKLVQLIESPVFTYLRLQLLEPERYPHLYKCLYGLLMLLPQSSAFAALKNRLNSVSAIGYLHIPQGSGAQYFPSSQAVSGAPSPGTIGSQATALRSTYVSSAVSNIHSRQKSSDAGSATASTGKGTTPYTDATGQLQPREQPTIRWGELLDKFRSVQERARRGQKIFLDDSEEQDFGDEKIPGPEVGDGGPPQIVTNGSRGRAAGGSASVPDIRPEDRPGSRQHFSRRGGEQSTTTGPRGAPMGGRTTPSQQPSSGQTGSGQQATGKGKPAGREGGGSGGLSGRLERLTGGVAGRRTKR